MFARALRERTLSHAYLLSGPEGLAKTAFARELAVALVSACGGCGACAECERARRGIHPDLHVVEREGDLIRFEQVGPVIADLGLKPFSGSRRVWIIPEVEYLHPAAANKLLKSVEEPPDYVYFLLVTDRLERVLPTIVSRCQLVEFRPLSDAVVAAYLRESHGLDGVAAEALARLSGGAVERAARLAGDADRRAEYLKQVALLLAGVRGDKAADAQRAFIGVLERHQKQIKDDAHLELLLRVVLDLLLMPFEDTDEGPLRIRGLVAAHAGEQQRDLLQVLRPAVGVARQPRGALHGAARETRERFGRDAVEAVALAQVRCDDRVAQGSELDQLAAGHDRRQHALETVGDEQEVHVVRWLLDALEQLVGRRRVQVLHLGDDPHASTPGERLEPEIGDHRPHLLEADDVAFALDHVQVGVDTAARTFALRAGAAAAAGADERHGELAREGRLGQALGAAQQVRVAESALAQGAREHLFGLVLAEDVVEHGAPSAAEPQAGGGERQPHERIDVEDDREVRQQAAQTRLVDGQHRVDAQSAGEALIGERRVDEAVEDEHAAGAEVGQQHALDELGAGRGVQQGLGPGRQRLGTVKENVADGLAGRGAAGFADHGARGGRRADRQPAGGEALAEKRRLRALAAAVAALKRDQHAAPFAHAGLPRGLPGKGSRSGVLLGARAVLLFARAVDVDAEYPRAPAAAGAHDLDLGPAALAAGLAGGGDGAALRQREGLAAAAPWALSFGCRLRLVALFADAGGEALAGLTAQHAQLAAAVLALAQREILAHAALDALADVGDVAVEELPGLLQHVLALGHHLVAPQFALTDAGHLVVELGRHLP